MNDILKLRQKANGLPELPGVYIMKNITGDIIYIGKAKILKDRVSQYFRAIENHDEKVKKMVLNVYDFEYIITDSEFEALILECSLIKQHQPKYNILLKDDKGYHYIKITNDQWPKIKAVKQIINDAAQYIGPYTSSNSISKAVDEALKIFKLPSCNKNFLSAKNQRPCLDYYINQCSAPCVGKINKGAYLENINEAVEFLKGGNLLSIKNLTAKMNKASSNLQFEKAAAIRDKISAINKIGTDKQKVILSSVKEQDVIALAKGTNNGCFVVFKFLKGRLYSSENFIFDDIGVPETARMEFIQQYYSRTDKIPPVLLLDGAVESSVVISEWLTQRRGKKVKIIVPKKGEMLKVVQMCRNNAFAKLSDTINRTLKETSALEELSAQLHLKSVPEYIEAYDISNLSGDENVAGMIVFVNGRPLKSAYRKFKIKSFDGQDDYAAMSEVISRRMGEYEKLKETNEGFGRMPDLILLDGGKGHVSVIKKLLEMRGYNSLPVYGMVKDSKHRTRAISSDGGEICIKNNRTAFTLISHIQEEVHRFAIGYHRKLREKNTISSELLSIPGIGKKRANSLLCFFKSMEKIKNATVDELRGVPGINRLVAKAIYDKFNNLN